MISLVPKFGPLPALIKILWIIIMLGVVEHVNNCTASNAKTQLIDKIQAAIAALPQDTVKATGVGFWSHLKVVVDA